MPSVLHFRAFIGTVHATLSLSHSLSYYLSFPLPPISLSLSLSFQPSLPYSLLQCTLCITGVFSESLSMGMDVACTHVPVGTCLSRTYEFLGTIWSVLAIVVEVSSNIVYNCSIFSVSTTKWKTWSEAPTSFCLIGSMVVSSSTSAAR